VEYTVRKIRIHEKCASLRYLEDSVFQLGLLDVLAVEGAGALGEVHQLARVITVRRPGYQAFQNGLYSTFLKGLCREIIEVYQRTCAAPQWHKISFWICRFGLDLGIVKTSYMIF
jgi:hypothetical protein